MCSLDSYKDVCLGDKREHCNSSIFYQILNTFKFMNNTLNTKWLYIVKKKNIFRAVHMCIKFNILRRNNIHL